MTIKELKSILDAIPSEDQDKIVIIQKWPCPAEISELYFLDESDSIEYHYYDKNDNIQTCRSKAFIIET